MQFKRANFRISLSQGREEGEISIEKPSAPLRHGERGKAGTSRKSTTDRSKFRCSLVLRRSFLFRGLYRGTIFAQQSGTAEMFPRLAASFRNLTARDRRCQSGDSRRWRFRDLTAPTCKRLTRMRGPRYISLYRLIDSDIPRASITECVAGIANFWNRETYAECLAPAFFFLINGSSRHAPVIADVPCKFQSRSCYRV